MNFLLAFASILCQLFDENFAHFFEDCGRYRLVQLFDDTFAYSFNLLMHPFTVAFRGIVTS